MADLSGLEALARGGNVYARRLVVALAQVDDDNDRKAVIDRWRNEVRPVVHAAIDLAQSLGFSAAAANARANASTSASPSSTGGGDGAVGGTVSAPAGAGGSPTAPSQR